jgi:hypothetical protein
MTLYFEFDGRRVMAEVNWPKSKGSISVHITDAELASEMPPDLLFDITPRNKVSYTIEDPANKKLIYLQDIISRRLQEFVNKS